MNNFMVVLPAISLFIFSKEPVHGFETVHQGIPCTCPSGQYMVRECLGLKSAECRECPPNTFNPSPNRLPWCQYCKRCIVHASVTHRCKPTRDTVCHCATGFIEKHNTCIRKTECKCPSGSYVDEMCKENSLQPSTCKPCPEGTYNSNIDTSTSCADCGHGCPTGAHFSTPCNSTSDMVCVCKPGHLKTIDSDTGQWACVRTMDTSTNQTTIIPECKCPSGWYVDEMCKENSLQSSTCKPCPKGTYNSNIDTSTSCADCSHGCPTGAHFSTPCNSTSDMVCVCKPGHLKTIDSDTGQWACVRTMDTSTNPTTTIPDVSTNLNGERKMGRGRNIQGVPMLIYIASLCATFYILMVYR